MNTHQVARAVVGLAWIYHGLVPKLLYAAPFELAMAAQLGFSDEMTLLLVKAAGVAEIVFGLVFLALYETKAVQTLNLIGLTGLLLVATVLAPQSLLDAFNPLTTTLPLLALSYLLLRETA